MILKCLDGSFRSIDSMLVWWHELPLYVFRAQVFCDGSRCFVVQNVELRFESFAFEIREDIFESIDNGWGFAVWDGAYDDGICGVIICHENILFVF